MTRVLLGLLLGAVVFAGAVGAKVVNVQNPMTIDLDGGGHAIYDVDDLTADGVVTFTRGAVYLDGNHNRPSIRWVTQDPRTDPLAADAQPGSLALEFAFQQSSAWIKTGPDPADWRQLAFTP